jgi:RNA polymerase sigma-70 factor (ECF subfamily)
MSTSRSASAVTVDPVAGRFTRTTSHPESELVRRAIARLKEGDNSALHFIYVRYADDVCRYVQSIVRDPHEAEDLTHNVFAKLPAAIQRYEQRQVPFAAWIVRVARNVALDHMRARRQIPFEEVRTEREGDEADFDRLQSLREALNSLPEDQREVLVLRHIAGLTPTEIADRLGKSESSVHGLHHRGRGAIKAALKQLDAAPLTAGR